MPDPTTTNIVLTQPVNGADSGTWDVPMNGNSGILDACFGSVTSVALSSSNVVLTTTQAQVSIIRLTGVLSANCQVQVPIIKSWIIDNQTTGMLSFSAILTGGSGNICGIPPGISKMFWDGTNAGWVTLPNTFGEIVQTLWASTPPWILVSTTPPYLFCNGASFSSVTYPLLFNFLGSGTLPNVPGSVFGGINLIRAV